MWFYYLCFISIIRKLKILMSRNTGTLMSRNAEMYFSTSKTKICFKMIKISNLHLGWDCPLLFPDRYPFQRINISTCPVWATATPSKVVYNMKLFGLQSISYYIPCDHFSSLFYLNNLVQNIANNCKRQPIAYPYLTLLSSIE